MSVYDYNLKILRDVYTETNEFNKPLSYENNLFKLIEVLKLICKEYAIEQPELWQQYVLEHDGQHILKILFKASYKLVEEGAYPCLALLAFAFAPTNGLKHSKSSQKEVS